MSTPPTAKRRRLDSALHKPFVSPLKRPNTTPTNPAPTPSRPASLRPNTTHTPLRSSSLKFSRTTPSVTPTSSPSTTKDADVLATQASVRALETQARELRSQIATLEQAASLPSTSNHKGDGKGNKESRLEMLAAKWKVASQAAAEEVFGDFSQKVRENGGMKVLRKRQVECLAFDDVEERDGEGEEEEWRDEMGEVLTVREKESRRKEKMGRGKRVRGDVEDEEEEEEEELTVASMLAVLNIPLETIGWDVEKQAWES